MSDRVDLKKVKQIPQRQKDIVYGYIQKMQLLLFPYSNETHYFNMDQLIKNLCLLYFHQFKDRWVINDNKTFDYSHQVYGSWYHIFGELNIERGIINEYVWKIQTEGNFSGRIGIIDDTNKANKEGVVSIENGDSMIHHPNVICAGNHCPGASWFGTVYGKTDETNLYNFFATQDIVTITVNFDDNTLRFNSKEDGTEHTEKLKDTTNCIKLITEFSSHQNKSSVTIL